jgi:hypothetical protein
MNANDASLPGVSNRKLSFRLDIKQLQPDEALRVFVKENWEPITGRLTQRFGDMFEPNVQVSFAQKYKLRVLRRSRIAMKPRLVGGDLCPARAVISATRRCSSQFEALFYADIRPLAKVQS